MKESILKALTYQQNKGNELTERLREAGTSEELDAIITEYKFWDDLNSKILDKGFEQPQLYKMYSGVRYMGNVNIDPSTFQAKRAEILYCLPRKINHLRTAINYTESAAKTDLLPIGEIFPHDTPPTKKEDNTLIKTQSHMKKLFISHANADAAIVKHLVDLIESIGLRPGYNDHQIFFSSHPAYGVGLGENIFVRLKEELTSDVFALFLLSENFYKSAVCLCEMGAVWIKSNKQIPILIPPFSFGNIQGVFPGSLGFMMNDKDQLNSFKSEIESYFNLVPIHITRWEEKREEYLSKVNALIKNNEASHPS